MSTSATTSGANASEASRNPAARAARGTQLCHESSGAQFDLVMPKIGATLAIRLPKRRLSRHGMFLILALWILPVHSSADVPAVSVNALLSDTQRTSDDPTRIGLVWWLPVELWEISMSSDPVPSTPEQIAALTSILRSYTLFAVADGIVGQFGGVTWISKEDLRSAVILQDSSGTRYAPLKEEQISPDARNLAALMKPMLANMLGPMGEHIEFFFFPGTSESGKPIADAKAEGSFRFQLGPEAHDWRLPLGSLTPKKVCPVDGEELNGSWKYCPWHGKKLKSRKD